MADTRKKRLFFIAGIHLLLILAVPALAGDGDVDYSAPYITVDPETGKLITVNPGPELKMHAPTPAGQAAQDDSDGSRTIADQDAAASVSPPPAGESESGLPYLVPAVIAGLILLSVAVSVVRNLGTASDA